MSAEAGGEHQAHERTRAAVEVGATGALPLEASILDSLTVAVPPLQLSSLVARSTGRGRADLLMRLERSHGNAWVQRLVSEVRGQQMAVQRAPAPAGAAVAGAYPGAPSKSGKPAPGTELSSELSDAPAASTPAERVFKWLQGHAKEIAAQEAQFGVDRRAIAGAIAWEALENPKGRLAHAGGRFTGAGKPHVKQYKAVPAEIYTGENVPQEVEEAGLLPRRSLPEREMALISDSIPYIGAGMRLATDIARKYGKDISSDPAMLTWFWQSKDANSFIEYLSTKRGDTFNPTAERMPKWVMENLGWLSDAVGNSGLTPSTGRGPQPKVGTMETESWKGSYSIDARLPETREFLVNGGQVSVKITAETDIVTANGYPLYVVLHRREKGSNTEVGEAKRAEIGKEITVSWAGLSDGLYFLEIFSYNGVHVQGDLEVDLPARTQAPAAAVQPGAIQRLTVQRAPDAGVADARPGAVPTADAGTSAPQLDEGALRADAARTLVRQLQAKKAVYGHELATPAGKGGSTRKEGWWWNETEFDCSKFVLWVLAGRQVGGAVPGPDESKSKAIREVHAEPFGAVSDASSVAVMVDIVGRLAMEGKAGAIDKARVPEVGDLMFWGGHVAIVVELKPAEKGEPWIVYANMGTTGAGLVGVDRNGHYWLKLSQIEQRPELAAGSFLGFWSP